MKREEKVIHSNRIERNGLKEHFKKQKMKIKKKEAGIIEKMIFGSSYGYRVSRWYIFLREHLKEKLFMILKRFEEVVMILGVPEKF